MKGNLKGSIGLRLVLLACLVSLLGSDLAWAKKKVIYRKTQDVNFDGANIDGVARTPDGAYLNQKRGVKFLPLYKVKKKFQEGIKESGEYLR